ncbi:hypothetical protein CVT24_006052 [Panaeolus cyanescens]|uniref:mannan endo-1,4-beta-mannosidase n=1 Tax=Panaeolus cyanescens TaxID=181874 RepID=A0A409YDU0_9AGAR|nr:hypothetical protein CVT24_006052 [Panaeolus cyanescens]
MSSQLSTQQNHLNFSESLELSMKTLSTFVLLALSYRSALAAVPLWGQCGGRDYTGETVCVSGAYCSYSNEWYSQCIPGTGPTTAPTTTAPTPTTTSPPPASTGFVKVSGTRFTLNGAKYTVVGGNSYWVGLSGLSDTDMNTAFSDIAKAGGTTCRTWGFNEVTSASGTYYQSWSGSSPTVNTGSSGLQSFDRVVSAAKKNNIRLIVALTNNWADYGGMDVYVKQILNSNNHDLFYTDSRVKTAFKNYIGTFVSRYANEPTIMAWELANEPRCRGSSGTSSGSCNPSTITTWIQEIAAYIKSVDSNHLVAVGDEGFYNKPSAPTYPYQGSEGIDFDANLKVSGIDFGTFHSYPEHWGQSNDITNWGTQWIKDHAASQNSIGKPVILEEFGTTSNKDSVYTAWFNAIISSGLAGDLVWQSGSRLSSGSSHDDGFTLNMKTLSTFVLLALSYRSALAAVPLWGQCGGNYYTGETVCVADAYCSRSNEWYSQCVPGTGPTTSSTVPTTTVQPTSTTTSAPPAATGFVKVSGTRFTLNGAKYTVVGGNSYWVGLTDLSDADMNTAFSDIAKAGGTTCRTWGFREVNSTSIGGTFYQSWTKGSPTINTGPSGLQSFDRVVSAAKKNNIRLIVALTNNWEDYGGMDVYVKQILNSDNHDLFYTDSRVKTAFKNYVRTFVSRYANEPIIMAWELANEPRCKGSAGISSGSCNSSTITAWIQEMTAYIKSIDSNHLVAVGDEGFYNIPSDPTYPYQGSEGIDFDANLKVPGIDFGTFHSYPEHWGQTDNITDWGVQWIKDHAASQNSIGKPVILEEFGSTSNKDSVYPVWFDAIMSSGLAGDLVWQSGSRLSSGNTHDDGFAVFPGTTVYDLLGQHASALKARD